MKAALISLGSVSSKMIFKSMQKYFDKVDSLDVREIEINLGPKKSEVLYKGKSLLNDYDCVYAKGSFRYATLLESITLMFGKDSYMPITAEAFTTGNDKILTHLKLQEHQIPMPKTYLAASSKAAKKILEKVSYPVVMKFPSGTQGKGVMFADSFASASSFLDALTVLKQPLLIQEYVDTGDTDIRAIVVGDKVVASMRRKAERGEMRANIHAGGEGEVCHLDAHTKNIAVATANSIGADVCAVDMLESVKGPLVIEINLSPGLQGITKITKIDVAEKIAKFLYENTKNLKEGSKGKGLTEVMRDLEIKKDGEKIKEIFTNPDFRGERILLPAIITKLTKFKERDELIIMADEGEIVIKKLRLGEEEKKKKR